jgi:hypothetical protein
LRNGDWILFYPEEIATYEQQWPVDVVLDTDRPRSRKARTHAGGRPGAEQVHRLLSVACTDSGPVGTEPGVFLERAEIELRAAGIVVANLTKALRQAAKDLERHEYVYWRHDTHWNGRSVAVAAGEIDRIIPDLRQACRPPW